MAAAVAATTTRHVRALLPSVVVAAVAVAARLLPVLRGGGLKGVGGYDDGVYFAASEAVVHGLVPYRDFMLLHPPGLVYLLTPFAASAHQLGDANAWAVARVFIMLVGAGSAVLIVAILRPFGLGSALAGGLLYAVWFPALNAEFSTLLEGPTNAMLLAALFLLLRRSAAGSDPRGRAWLPQLAAGALLGCSASTKIWGVVPFAVIVGWQLLTRGRRAAVVVLVAGVTSIVLVCGPTYALAPSRMTTLVVSDQLRRSASNISPLLRAANFTPVSRMMPAATQTSTAVAVGIFALLGVLCAACAWTRPTGRVFVVLLLAQLLVLGASPSYFPHYGAILAPPVALTTGMAVAVVRQRLRDARPAGRRGFVAALVAAWAVLAVPAMTTPRMSRFDAPEVSAALAGRACVASDTPGGLVLADRMSLDLDRHCPIRVDVTGPTYNIDRVVGADGRTVPRRDNQRWQRDILGYLLSEQAAIVSRAGAEGLDAHTRQVLHALPVLYRGSQFTVYGTHPATAAELAG